MDSHTSTNPLTHFDVHSFVNALCGSNHTSQTIQPDITRISNNEFDIYIKRNQMLLMIDKRSSLPTVYANLKTALHYLQWVT